MHDLANVIAYLKNPFSGGYLLFWAAIVLACVALWLFESRRGEVSRRVEGSLFWLFAIAMLFFAMKRPFGMLRDDLAYLNIYHDICPTLTCLKWVQGGSDIGWYSLVGLFKSFIPSPRVMLLIEAGGLLVKMAVIYTLVRRPLYALMLYAGVFYQVQDLVALRVSLAVAAYMAAIWLVVVPRQYCFAWTLFIGGFFHKQAFFAPLTLLGAFFKRRAYLLVLFSLIPVALIILNIYPDWHQLFPQLGKRLQMVVNSQGLGMYFSGENDDIDLGWRNAPIVVYPQILLMLWLLIKTSIENDRLDAILSGCLVMACLFLWAFASVPNAQVRFFEFFMVPTVMLVGIRRLTWYELVGVVGVSGIYIAKYNVIHRLVVQP